MAEPMFFATAAAWRQWLAEHHQTAAECLVGFVKVGTGNANMTWSDAVDEALCVGWIDGVRRRIDDHSYSIRFTPRKPGGNWSAVNVAKVETLREAGRMTPAGERAYAARRADRTGVYSFEKPPTELSEAEQAALADDAAAWEFWQSQPPSYRRMATHWVNGAKREQTRGRRFAELLADCGAGRRLRHLSRWSSSGKTGSRETMES